MTAAAVPQNSRDIVFHYSRARALIAFIVFAMIAIGLLLFGRWNHAWLAYYAAAVLIIVLLIFQKLLTARFRLSNWLVRMIDDGLFVKFRSYLNEHFPDQDRTVVFIPYSEIRAATPVKQRRELPERSHNRPLGTTSTRRVVDLELAADTRQLAVVLASEAKLIFGKGNQPGGRISTRYQHTPVRLGPADRLRIEWGVVPGVDKLMQSLTRHTLVKPQLAVTENFTGLETLSREEQERRLLELAQSGDMIGAVTLARRLYGYDLTKAKEFVESLAATRSAQP